jgi:curved DNA-binding protein CbpA
VAAVTRRQDPFAQLGLPADAGLTDDDVRAAWRRAATATHPDRPDGGDPERFAAAAAAYTALRTPFGRGEALADLRAAARRRPAHPVSRLGFVSRVRRGRPVRLTLRCAAVVAAGVAAAATAGAQPGTPAVITGAVTWLILTARHDIAPPR